MQFFSFGILLAASGFYLQEKKIDLTAPLSSEETEAIFKIGQNMVKDTLAKDFIGLEQKSIKKCLERRLLLRLKNLLK